MRTEKRVTRHVYAGIFGPAILTLGALVSAFLFQGQGDQHYSVLNHYISELGDPAVPASAAVFNSGMIAGGVAISWFMLGLGRYLKSRLGWVAAGGGVFAGGCCALIGVFPVSQPLMHATVAYSFFYSGLTTVVLFIVVILTEKEGRVAKWLSIPGIVTMLCFASFLVVRFVLALPNSVLGMPGFVRPKVWPAAILEWSVFFSVIIWILLVSLYLTRSRTAS